MKRYIVLRNLGLYEILDTLDIFAGKPRMIAIFASKKEAHQRCADFNKYVRAAA